MKAFRWIGCGLVSILTGCATVETATIETVSDPRYNVSKIEPIHVLIDNKVLSMSLSDRALAGLVESQMRTSGFNLVASDRAKYFLTVKMEDETHDIDSQRPVSETAYTSGHVGSTTYSANSTSTSWKPYSYKYRTKKLYTHLHYFDKENEELINNVWFGYIGAGHREFDLHTRALIQTMLNHFGENFNERVPINSMYQ